MGTSRDWQLSTDAADRYEAILVPSILGPAAKALVDWTQPKPEEFVLDLGCGTGIAARHVQERAGRDPTTLGLDINPAMLRVAAVTSRDQGHSIRWIRGSALGLPLRTGCVDLAVSAQTLQFLSDPLAVVREVRRVLRPGGRAAVSVWSQLPDSPYFEAVVESITTHVGPDVAAGLLAAFALSDPSELGRLFSKAGFERVRVETRAIDLGLPTAKEFVPIHIEATPMATGFRAGSRAAREAVVETTARRLEAFRTEHGMTVPFSMHFVSAEV